MYQENGKLTALFCSKLLVSELFFAVSVQTVCIKFSVRCFNRNVKYAYHIVCTQCVAEYSCCAKCNKNKDVVGE